MKSVYVVIEWPLTAVYKIWIVNNFRNPHRFQFSFVGLKLLMQKCCFKKIKTVVLKKSRHLAILNQTHLFEKEQKKLFAYILERWKCNVLHAICYRAGGSGCAYQMIGSFICKGTMFGQTKLDVYTNLHTQFLEAYISPVLHAMCWTFLNLCLLKLLVWVEIPKKQSQR